MMPIPRISIRWRVSSGAGTDEASFLFLDPDDVVGNEPVAPFDQPQRRFAFPNGRFSLDQHSDAKELHQRSVQSNVWEKFSQKKKVMRLSEIRRMRLARKRGIFFFSQIERSPGGSGRLR